MVKDLPETLIKPPPIFRSRKPTRLKLARRHGLRRRRRAPTHHRKQRNWRNPNPSQNSHSHPTSLTRAQLLDTHLGEAASAARSSATPIPLSQGGGTAKRNSLAFKPAIPGQLLPALRTPNRAPSQNKKIKNISAFPPQKPRFSAFAAQRARVQCHDIGDRR